jgi:hypothetical protein
VRSPSWAAEYAERQARALYCRERRLNEVIERRCPNLKPTPEYQRGPLPAWLPRFYSPVERITYLARREMGKFDPNVRY